MEKPTPGSARLKPALGAPRTAIEATMGHSRLRVSSPTVREGSAHTVRVCREPSLTVGLLTRVTRCAGRFLRLILLTSQPYAQGLQLTQPPFSALPVRGAPLPFARSSRAHHRSAC